MAISKVGGAFGYLRKSIGSVTYAAPKLGIKQERQQVARAKVTEVNNPNTVGQIMQRMKMGAAVRFFGAYENVVNKGVLSHSFEKIKYGQPSRLYFMKQALKNETAVYVPYGVDYFVPGEYLVSEGSLQSIGWRKELATAPTENIILDPSAPMTAEQVAALAAYNIKENDQITIMTAVHKDGRYFPACARVIVGVGNAWAFTSGEFQSVLQAVKVDATGTYAGGNVDGTEVAALAVIISRGMQESSDARSTETMLFVNGYASLKSPEALQAAIDSYITATAYNSLNSEWYLNQGNGQAFNGRVIAENLLLSGELAEENKECILALQQNNGVITYTIFTADGTAAGKAFVTKELGSQEVVADDQFTGADVADALGVAAVSYAILTPAIAEQGGFILGEE